jgi:two-component system, chemotaxis family, protein-glutamate methylesterase/glutaminase
MRKIRVLVVDDSTVIRRLLTDALISDPAIEIAGTAANGRIALAKLTQINPDLITLDMEMPDMDGLETLAELRKTHPRLPVIMFSTLTQKGAIATLNALSLGASDYVTKPANVGGVTAAIQAVKSDLIPKIKALCRFVDAPHTTPTTVPKTRVPQAREKGTLELRLQRFDIIAIGVSTGGPNALTEIFRQLPVNLPVPIVIVQHMPPVFTKYLAERLSSVSPLEVSEAKTGDMLHPGKAWLAPGNFHMSLLERDKSTTVSLHQAPPENSCRPAADVLFRSVAENYGPTALAVVLTGMGQDGLRGCEAISAAGGKVIAQDEESSIVWGMPGAIVGAGLADAIIPLSRMASEITSLAGQRRGKSGILLTAVKHV